MSEVVQAIFKKLSVSNEEMIKKFLTNDYPKDANYPLSTINNLMIARKDDGWNLINYDTPLLINRNGLFFFNNLKYSQSTTIIQNKIKQIARELGIPLIEDNQENGYQDTLKNIDKIKERQRMKNRSIKEIQVGLKRYASPIDGLDFDENEIDNPISYSTVKKNELSKLIVDDINYLKERIKGTPTNTSGKYSINNVSGYFGRTFGYDYTDGLTYNEIVNYIKLLRYKYYELNPDKKIAIKKQADFDEFNDDYFAMDESDLNNLDDINSNEVMYKVTVRGDVGGDTSNEYSTEEDARRKYEEAKALSDYVTLSRVDKKSGTEDILEDYNIDHENTEIENVFND